MSARAVKITLDVDADGVVRGVKTADGQLVKLERSVKDTDLRIKDMGQTMQVAMGTMLGTAIGKAIGLLGQLARAGVGVLNDAVQGAGMQQIAERKLEQALTNLGDASEASAQKLKDVANEVASYSNFADDAIITSQALLGSFKGIGGAEGIALLTPRLADMAAGVAKVTGEMPDLNSMANAVGKAAQGSASSLKKFGVSLTEAEAAAVDAASGMDKARIIAQILDNNFKGMAAATANPFVMLKKEAGELAEVFGQEVLPYTQEVANKLRALATDESVKEFVREAGAVAAQVLQDSIELLTDSIEFYKRYNGEIALAAKVLVSLTGAMAAWTIGAKLLTAATWATTLGFKGLNTVIKANPIGFLASMIALILPLIWQFRSQISEAGAVVLDFAAKIVRGLGTAWTWIRDTVNKIPESIRNAIPALRLFSAGANLASSAVNGTASALERGASKLRGYAAETARAATSKKELSATTDDNRKNTEDETGAIEANTEAAKKNAEAYEQMATAREFEDYNPVTGGSGPSPQADNPYFDFDLVSEKAGSLAALNKEIAALNEQFDLASTSTERDEIAAQIDVLNQQKVAIEAVRDAKEKEREATEKAREASEKRREAMVEEIAQTVASADTSVRSARDVANSIMQTARKVIQAQLAQTIAKAIASIPFPANLILGAGAAASLNLLFNRLVPKFASGVSGFGGGMAIVGEAGPESVFLPQGSSVLSHGDMMRAITGSVYTQTSSADVVAAIGRLEKRIGNQEFQLRGTTLVAAQARQEALYKDAGIK